MNERIKKLANKANAWFPKGYPSAEGGDEEWKNLVIFEKEDLEAFVGLIINDCTKCGNLLASHYIDTHTEQEQALLLAAIADYSSEIKKHFGFDINS